jgi:hypothetical protein
MGKSTGGGSGLARVLAPAASGRAGWVEPRRAVPEGRGGGGLGAASRTGFWGRRMLAPHAAPSRPSNSRGAARSGVGWRWSLWGLGSGGTRRAGRARLSSCRSDPGAVTGVVNFQSAERLLGRRFETSLRGSDCIRRPPPGRPALSRRCLSFTWELDRPSPTPGCTVLRLEFRTFPLEEIVLCKR